MHEGKGAGEKQGPTTREADSEGKHWETKACMLLYAVSGGVPLGGGPRVCSCVEYAVVCVLHVSLLAHGHPRFRPVRLFISCLSRIYLSRRKPLE